MPDLIDLSKMETCIRKSNYGYNRIDRYWHTPIPEQWDSMWATVPVEQYWVSALKGVIGREYKRLIVNALPPRSRVLEAGCGVGQVVLALRTLGFDCYGLDFASDTVRKLNARFPSIPFIEGDIRRLPFPSEYFDAYISLGVMEHFLDGQDTMLSEAARVVKPGGRIFVSVPAFNLWRKRKFRRSANDLCPTMPFFESCISLEEMADLMSCAGFDLEAHSFMNPVMGFVQETPLRSLYRLIEDTRFTRSAVDRVLSAVLPKKWFGHMLMVVGRRRF